MHRKLGLSALVAVALAFATNGRAQSVCTTTSAPTQLRAEGTVEVLGELSIRCPNLPSVSTALTVSIPAVLAPTSPVPDNQTTFPMPTISSTVPFAAGPQISLTTNTVTFGFTTAAGSQTIVISGIRVNLPASGLPPGSSINGILGVSESKITFTDTTAVLGIIADGLGNGSGFPNAPLNIVACSPAIPAPQGLPVVVAGNPDPSPLAANSLQVSFVEGVAGAFRTTADEDGGLGGLQGTRLLIRLTGVPSGIIPYAPRVVSSTSAATTGSISTFGSPLVIQRVNGSVADGSAGFVLPAVANQFDQIPVNNGTATLVYEVTSDDLSEPVTVNLYVVLAATSGLVTGNITGAISLAPLGPPTAAPARPQFAPSTAIGASPAPVAVQAFVNTNAASQLLTISNLGSGVMDWSATVSSISGGNWLTLADASGVNGGAITLAVSSSSLPDGVYNATITISSPEAVNSPLNVPLSLSIIDHPVLAANPSSLQFSLAPGSGPGSQQLLINSSVEATAFMAATSTTSGGNWLSISPSSGMTSATATVTANPAGLAPGTYQGAITLSGPDAAGPQVVPVTLSLATPAISLTPSSLAFTTSAGVNPPVETFQIQNTGAGVLGWTASVSTLSGGDWLSVAPSSSTAPSTVQVAINAQNLTAGAYLGRITVSATAGSGAAAQVLNVILGVDVPILTAVANAASFANGAISPGMLAVAIGTNLAQQIASAPSSGALPTTLGGSQVMVNGVAAPLLYVSPGQINFQVPVNTSGAQAQVFVAATGPSGTIGGASVTANPVTLAAATPGIFTVPSTGAQVQGAVVNDDGTLNSPSNPAHAGSFVSIYATGLGATTPPAVTGQPAPVSTLSQTAATPTVLIGGVPVPVSFSGLAPGLVGLDQLNVTIPSAIQPSSAVPVQIQIGSAQSNIVYIAVE